MVEQYNIRIQIDGKDAASDDLLKVGRGIDALGDKVKNSARSADQGKQAFGAFNQVLGGLGITLGLGALTKGVVDLARLGDEARAAERVFTALTGGVQQADAALAMLRRQTGGIVDDLTLMRGANQLLTTGLAQTSTQAAGLVEMAVRLGGALGQDAAGAIDNLNSALLNTSYVRLDTLGISAQRVRDRVEELKATGLETSQAFAQAVWEAGQETIASLGDAASVGETNIARLGTAVQNLAQDFGQTLVGGINDAIGTLITFGQLADVATGGSGGNTAVQYTRDLTARATGIRNQRLGGSTTAIATQDVRVEDVALWAQRNPELFAQISGGSTFTNMATGRAWAQPGGPRISQAELNQIASDLGFDLSSLSPESLIEISQEIDLALASVADAQRELRQETEDTAKSQAQQTTEMDGQASSIRNLTKANVGLNEERRSLLLTENALFDAQRQGLAALEESAQFFSRGGLLFFDPQELAAVEQQAADLEERAEHIAQLAEDTDFEVITREEVQHARDMADEARNIADNAERAAESFANANLAQLAGQTGGGVVGDLTDIILQSIDNPEVRAATERALNLASGRETPLSIGIEEQIAPAIAEGAELFGPDWAADATERVARVIRDGVAAGLSDEQILNLAVQITGQGPGGTAGAAGGTTITIQPGDTLWDISRRTGIPLEQLLAANEGSSLILPGQQLQVGGGPPGSAGVSLEQQQAAFAQLASAQPLWARTTGRLPGEPGPDLLGPGQREQNELAAATLSMLPKQDDLAAVTSIEEKLAMISQTDLSAVFDPFHEDIISTAADVDKVHESLTRLTHDTFTATVPLKIVLDDETGLELARNPVFQQAIRWVFESLGIRIEDLGK